ncbi:MAG: permease prefix domain 1-containing protein [Gemmatimonadales bacterium]
MPDPTAQYLNDLAAALRWRPVLARRVLIEVADHLADAAAHHRNAGLPAEAAEQAAIRQFGPAAQIAGQYRPAGLSLGFLLAAGAGATALVVLWLLYVTTFILPARDPADVTLWRIIAGLFGGFSVVSALVLDAPRRRFRRGLTAALSVAAIGFGLLAALVASGGETGSRDGEGYLLLMGVMIAGHGMVALAFTLFSGRVPTPGAGGS